ncbi:MAG: hypothetical protein ABDH16_06075 [Thermodesulfovibrionaceae bacterium]
MHLVFTILLLVFLIYGIAEAMKCNKCHKEDKSLDKIFQQKAINTREDLFNILRKGLKARIHQHITDEEIDEAVKQMNLE